MRTLLRGAMEINCKLPYQSRPQDGLAAVTGTRHPCYRYPLPCYG